jgi:hypothetical protein
MLLINAPLLLLCEVVAIIIIDQENLVEFSFIAG